MSVYETLSVVDVNHFTEKKGRFTYLSWAHAVGVLQKHYPTAAWEVREWDGAPYLVHKDIGGFVCVTVTVDGLSRTQWHPILDNNNKTIAADKIDAFDVNRSIQRCLAKAIALHGLGLYVFQGEDLPDQPPPKDDPQPPKDRHASGMAAVKKAALSKGIAQDSLADWVKAQFGVFTLDLCTVEQLTDAWKAIQSDEVSKWLNARVPS